MLSVPDPIFHTQSIDLRSAYAPTQQIEDGLLYRWMKDADDYGADLPRADGLWELVTGKEEKKNEAGEVTRPAKAPTVRAMKSESRFVFIDDGMHEDLSLAFVSFSTMGYEGMDG